MTTLTGRAKDLFLDALDIPGPADRLAFLDRACGPDVRLRSEVEDLLAHHREVGSFLATPSADPAATATLGAAAGPTAAADDPPGPAVGPYRLLEPIGEGGFGVVYLAEQSEPVRRRVALKVLKPGMDTREVVARFEAERQALALMDHPHIAKVLDAGATPAGRPYFVMELVKGVPITKHCDDRRLPVRDRLGLFADLCGAVQHAHQKGVIHRDLKPTNILVAEADGRPVVKVIDFGVAKAVGPGLTDKTVYTRLAQMIGTPLYMSPEQAGGGPDVDTRSDVYSLGVVLYELLTGATPFDADRLRSAGYDELRRVIREEEPARPSTRLSTLAQAATASANRGTDPRKLSRLVRGDLDWVVMKALEKDRNRRYESAGAVAADVRRFLADEPVVARPPTAGYRLRKFARRNRAAVLTAAAVAAALVVGLVGTAWGLVRATTAEAAAKDEAKQKADALTAKGEALTEAQDQLFAGLVNQSRAVRVSGGVGQRFDTLAAVRKAAAIRATPELRDDATAALVLPDLELAREWDGWPDGTVGVGFDAAFDRYVRLDREGGLTVCKLADGREEVVARLPAHGAPMFVGPWVSPDGRFAAYAHGRQGGPWAGVRVWRLDGPAPAVVLDEPAGMFESAFAFRPDGRQMAVGHPDRTVSVYDMPSGRRVHRITVGGQPGYFDYHPTDHRLAVSDGRALRFLDTDAGKELPAPRHPPAAPGVYAVTWHPDGRRLAVCGGDRKIHVLDPDTGEVVSSPPAYGGEGVVLRFNHAGDRLVSTGWGTSGYVWEAASLRPLLSLRGHHGLQFSPDDGLLGYNRSGAKLQLWRPAFGREYRTLRRRGGGPTDALYRPVIHPDGRTVGAGDRGGLAFFDLATGEELGSARHLRSAEHVPVCYAAPAGGDPGGWVTAGAGGLSRWPARPDPVRPGVVRVGPPETIAPGLGSVFSLGAAATPDGRVLAVPLGRSAAVIDRDRPDRRLALGPQFDLRHAAVSPDGRWVFTGSHWVDGRTSSARIWDGETGRPAHEFPLEGATSAAFSPDGRRLVTTTDGVGSRLWEVGTWREVRRFEVGSTTFGPDGLLAVSGGVVGVIRLVEAETGREVARLTAPDAGHYVPAGFTPDGTRLLTIGGDAVGVWDLRAIRGQLKELGLDWDWPEFPPAAPSDPPPRVELVTDDGGGDAGSPEGRARRAIAKYAADHAAAPDAAVHCNNLAWAYLTAPEPVRDAAAALPLAEKADRLSPGNAVYRNTLGLAYYRAGRFADAARVLRPNLDVPGNAGLAYDLYFLAMSRHRHGEPGPARVYYDWAVRWVADRKDLPPNEVEELTQFRAEAEAVLGIGPKND